jgi:uncharacterized protein YukE
VASGGFTVIPSELIKTAARYQTEGDDVGQAQVRFRAAASLPDSAFGNLPQSKALASQYQQFFDQVTRDVTKLRQALHNGAVNLAGNAVGYMAAEQVVLAYLRNVNGQENAEPSQGH